MCIRDSQSPARQVATVNVPKDSTSATATVAMDDLNVGDMIGAIIAASTPAADSIAAVESQTNGPKVTSAQKDPNIDNTASYVSTVKSNPTVDVNDDVKITFDFRNSEDYSLSGDVYKRQDYNIFEFWMMGVRPPCIKHNQQINENHSQPFTTSVSYTHLSLNRHNKKSAPRRQRFSARKQKKG